MDKKTAILEVKLGDKVVELKGNWKCVQTMEQRLGKGIVEFAVNDLQNLKIGVGTIGHIYYAGLRGHGDTRLSYDEICEAIISDGVMEHMPKAAEFVSTITSSGRTGEEESEKKS